MVDVSKLFRRNVPSPRSTTLACRGCQRAHNRALVRSGDVRKVDLVHNYSNPSVSVEVSVSFSQAQRKSDWGKHPTSPSGLT